MKNYILTINNEPMAVITTSDAQLDDFKSLIPLAVKENLSLEELPELKEIVLNNSINYDLFLVGEDGEEIEAYLIQTEIYSKKSANTETLESASSFYAKNYGGKNDKESFIRGAQWQKDKG